MKAFASEDESKISCTVGACAAAAVAIDYFDKIGVMPNNLG
jgi:hypothetical protein